MPPKKDRKELEKENKELKRENEAYEFILQCIQTGTIKEMDFQVIADDNGIGHKTSAARKFKIELSLVGYEYDKANSTINPST